MSCPFTLLLLLAAFVANAQQPAYHSFDVQQAAEPHGGFDVLNQFMTVNIRKPFMAQVANIKGMVILQGVVEPDGRIADVTIVRPLRPDCDNEAVRAFSLFNAWKPARKDGKTVRQVVTVPVLIRVNAPILYENGVVTRFYDARMNSVSASDSTAYCRSETPTNGLGLPTGSLRLFVRKGNKWKQEADLFFAPEAYKNGGTLLIHRMPNLSGFGPVFILNKQGQLVSDYVQAPDGTVGLRLDRNDRGMVIQRTEFVNGTTVVTNWYENGQLKSMWMPGRFTPGTPRHIPEQMLAYWDSTGVQLVAEGTGKLTRTDKAYSMLHYNQPINLIEERHYEKGLKQGRWTGRYTDGSCWFEQYYDKGVWQGERLVYAGKPDTLVYANTEQPPGFGGGIQGLNRYLSANLRYPPEARREKIEGRVLVRFTVNTSGLISNIRVEQGLREDADWEAVRLVKLMNESCPMCWTAGRQMGRPTTADYTLPIHFFLK